MSVARSPASADTDRQAIDREEQLFCFMFLWDMLKVRQTAALSPGELRPIFDSTRPINRTARRQVLAWSIALMRDTAAPQDPHA
jgi:hypothetical protein